MHPASWSDRRSPAPPEEVSPLEPTEFTGYIVCGDVVRSGTDQVDPDGVLKTRSRGWAWNPAALRMTDPRLQGDYYISYDDDEYSNDTSVGAGTWRIVNAEGAWQGSFTVFDALSTTTTVSTPLVGEGAYAGLTAIWESSHDPLACSWDVRGLIVEGGEPPAPEPYLPE